MIMEDYEKKYKEALLKMQKKVEAGVVDECYVEDVFSELKESKNERIRKAIFNCVKWFGFNSCFFKDVSQEECLAWLEGEHANFLNKIQVGDKVTRNKDGALVNLSQLNRIAKKNEKQGEQKPAEFTQEDKKILSSIIADYERSNEEWFYAQKSLPHGGKIIWLKSLKDRVHPQNHWKPSEQDILLFERIIQGKSDPKDFQASLTNILERLKEL